MGFLNPLFLLAGAVVLVPVILHLFYRQESKTFTFPAIRYLLRTEREHARQIRTQQILLLLLRAATVILLVLLGARLHLPGPGGSHDPTALALVIDNSMSTTVIRDGRRLLDTLKAVAHQSVTAAGHDDVIWVVRAGTSWEPAVPGGIEEARAAIDATVPSHAAGDLGRAMERARALVGQSDLPKREVHVFTDLQATAFSPSSPRDDAVPVVVFGAPASGAANRGIERVSLGGGLPPLAGRRTEAAVSIGGESAGDTVGVRLYIGGQVRAAARAPAGTTVRLPAGPFPAGRVEGHVEIDADPLTADDRRYFSFIVRDPTPVALFGAASIFLAEALAVLEESDRIALVAPTRAATLVSVGGEGIGRRGTLQSAVVAPHPDPAQLPALNRRLAEAGIPFRYDAGAGAGARIVSSDLPVDLGEVEIRSFFHIVPAGGRQGAGGAAGASGNPSADVAVGGGNDTSPPGRIQTGSLVSLSSGHPWLVAGKGPAGPYVLLASPLDGISTTLPVSAAMVPLLEWSVERWTQGGEETGSILSGTAVRPPATATAVEDPEGNLHAVDGDQPFLATTLAGLYRLLDGDSILGTAAVNPPVEESDLTPASAREVRRAIPGAIVIVDEAASWSGEIFRTGRGPEPWRLIAALVLGLLIAETIVAASRTLRSRAGGGERRDAATADPGEGTRHSGTAPNPAARG